MIGRTLIYDAPFSQSDATHDDADSPRSAGSAGRTPARASVSGVQAVWAAVFSALLSRVGNK